MLTHAAANINIINTWEYRLIINYLFFNKLGIFHFYGL